MASFARRAYAAILRLLASAADPSTDSTAALLYSKAVSATKQLFAMDSVGLVYTGTPYFGLCKTTMYACDDFGMSMTSTSSTANGGTTVFTTGVQGAPGIATQGVTTTVGPARTTLSPSNSVTAALAEGSNVVIFDSRCRTPTVQDGTDQWSDRWGTGDTTNGTDFNDGIYFESDRATYGDNDVRLCTSNASTRTKTSMGVAPTANTFERWKWICNADATSVQGYLNDAATGSAVTTNIPGSSAAQAVWIGQVVKTLGTVNTRNVDRDYFECYQIFSPTTR